jgi:hypothetical protein
MLDFVRRRAEGDLERFKSFIEGARPAPGVVRR